MTVTEVTRTNDRKAPFWWLLSRTAHKSAASLWLVSLVLFWRPLRDLASLSLRDENYSHILLIPLISASLIYLRRIRVFAMPRYCPSIGIPLLVLAAIF